MLWDGVLARKSQLQSAFRCLLYRTISTLDSLASIKVPQKLNMWDRNAGRNRSFIMSTITKSLVAASLLLSSSVASASTTENFLSTLRTPRPFHALASPSRNRTCVALSNNDPTVDDASNILQAVQDCDQGGHVLFAEKLTYTIASPLNLTGLSAIDLDIQGEINFTDNITSWLGRSFDLQYQNATSFFVLGGEDINVYGAGEVQGNGQTWWDAYVDNKKLKRPVLFAIVGLKGGSVSQIKLRNSPFWHNIIANSSNVVYSGLDLFSTSNNGNFEKNTDGWDIYRSDSIVIENSTITNGDGMLRAETYIHSQVADHHS